MTGRECEECPVGELRRIQRLVEKRALKKLPEEVREPLLEAKRQMRLALRGLIGYGLAEKKACSEKQTEERRSIKFE